MHAALCFAEAPLLECIAARHCLRCSAGSDRLRQRHEYDGDDHPLRNAPHTASMLISGDWKHSYDREEAAYPPGTSRRSKYWSPVRRIDQAYGDRNLMCSCPPPEAFES